MAILACAAPVSAVVAVDAAADADTITTSMSDSVGPVENSDATGAVDGVIVVVDDDGRSADGAKSTATPVTEASASRETIGGCNCGCCFCLISVFKVPASVPFTDAEDDDDGAANRTSGGVAEVAGTVDDDDEAEAEAEAETGTEAEEAVAAPGHGTAAIAGASLACGALTAKRCASKPPDAPACGTESCP